MTTKTDITLPKGITNHGIVGHDGPVYTDVMVQDIIRAAVEADRQGRMPSDDDIAAACKSLGWDLDAQEEADMILLVRTVMSCYSSDRPAASAEPILSALLGMQRFFGKWPEFVPAPEYISAAYDAVKRMNLVLSAAPVAAQAQSSGNASDEPEWLQSLRLEARDLSDRLDRLSRFLDTAGFRMLTDTDRGLLDRQGNQMHALLQTLNQRIHSGAGQHRRSKSHD